ncbi:MULTISPECIES: hypothetical protein [unclassified Streptomyces]|uniref:hypothetical protein n=1 Tax=unclassified Streptomyces TaxID=2593676 RepID=UPI001BE9A311|nr:MULTISPECIES: hypothetical protein [unclassified Streptomyces]MBT2404789.1 hypothetical protein [Streptomyces sp. ISL-21]MBT2609058.1 hypothetical protein [Streptomyces sp. ISL-87]
MSALLTLGAGALIGTLGALSGKFDSPIFHVADLVFSGGWSWACFAFLIGYARQSKIESAWLASSALAIGVAVYYLLKWLSPVAPIGMTADGMDGERISSGILVWGIAAFLFGAPMGLFGNLARIPGIGGLSFRLLVPLIAYVETSARLKMEVDTAAQFAEVTWSTIRVIAVLTALALVGHMAWEWVRSARKRESQA